MLRHWREDKWKFTVSFNEVINCRFFFQLDSLLQFYFLLSLQPLNSPLKNYFLSISRGLKDKNLNIYGKATQKVIEMETESDCYIRSREREGTETPGLISLISGWEMESTLSWPKVDFCNISFPIAYYPFSFVNFNLWISFHHAVRHAPSWFCISFIFFPSPLSRHENCKGNYNFY